MRQSKSSNIKPEKLCYFVLFNCFLRHPVDKRWNYLNGGTIELEAGRQSSENARKYASQLQILLRWPAVAGCVYY
jgi:hypothetical protein